MGRIKFVITASFWCMFAVSLLIKQSTAMYIYSLVMVIHEVAHYFAAKKLLYTCTKLQISAFGAVLYGEFDDMLPRHRLIVALAGPAINVLMAVLCVAFWWIVPTSYYYTADFCWANVTMAAINMLPAYPLDGGRVLTALLQSRISYAKSIAVVKNAALAIGGVLFAVFIISLFTKDNLFSLGMFAIFLSAGAFAKNEDATYRRMSLADNISLRTSIGMEKKTLVFSEDTPLSKVITKMAGNYWYCLEVVDDSLNVTARYDFCQLNKAILNNSADITLRQLGNVSKGEVAQRLR